MAVQEQQIYTLEARIAELTQARQASDERREAQERMNDDLRQKIAQQQTAIQTQQEQINSRHGRSPSRLRRTCCTTWPPPR